MSVTIALEALKAGRLVLVWDDEDPLRSPRWVGSLERLTPADLRRLSSLGDSVRLVAEPGAEERLNPAEFGYEILPATPGGVLCRRETLEGALDLVRMAGLAPRAATSAVDLGPEPALGEVPACAERLGLPAISLAEIAVERVRSEVLVDEVASARLPTAYGSGELMARAFISRVDGVEHLALVRGDPEPHALVRVHSECLTGDALGSLRCDCGEQLRGALARIGASRSGALIYLRGHEGRGIGLANKIRAYALQDAGLDTAEANAALGFAHDSRDYGVAAQILGRLGLNQIRLLTNNPRKASALRRYGVGVAEELPLAPEANPHNVAYLTAKRDKLGHRLPTLSPAGRLQLFRG